MLVIAAALKAELQPFILHYKTGKKINTNGGSLYIADDTLHLLCCGLGGEAFGKTLSHYLQKYRPDIIINIGTAGIINKDIKQGEVISVNKVYKAGSRESFELIPVKGFKTGRLLTVDEALTSRKLRDSYFLEYQADLADMEAWYGAQLSAEYNINFRCFKIASDHADENAEKDFMKNYKQLTQKLAAELIPVLYEMRQNTEQKTR